MTAKLNARLIEAEAAANRQFDDAITAARLACEEAIKTANQQYRDVYAAATRTRVTALARTRKHLEAAAPQIVDLAQVSSVYSGKNGRCCCGCSGKHTYASEYVKWAGDNRGYAVSADEVNDRTVKLIVNKINLVYAGLIEGGQKDMQQPDFISAVVGDRLYIAYLKQ